MLQLIMMFVLGVLFMLSINAILILRESDRMDRHLDEMAEWYDAEYGKEQEQ